MRFPHGASTRESAVTNSKVLFDAAARAGVERIVYISILHADAGSPYPYFSGKAEVERHLAATGVPYAIARPSILFGSSDGLGSAASVLVNNIAWLLRHLPVFGIGDGGGYRVRPIEVDDLARLCVELGGRTDNVTVDAVGPDAPTFRELVTAIRSATGSRALLVPAPGWLIPPLAAALGAALRDVLLTTEEYRAMADGLATSDAPSTGPGQPDGLDRRARRRTRPHVRQRTGPPLPPGPLAPGLVIPTWSRMGLEGRHFAENTGGKVD